MLVRFTAVKGDPVMEDHVDSGRLEKRRWLIAVAAVVIQLCLGTVYAWSIFKKPLMAAQGWKETQTQGTFMIYSFIFPICVAIGGVLADRKGPRFVGLLGGFLFGTGLILSGCAIATGNIFMLYGAYGIIAGLGGGFGYVTPITTLIRWFPDKRGLVTGLAVMGYGFGSFIMGRLGPSLIISLGITKVFILWGAVSLVLVLGSVLTFHNPPGDWAPAGMNKNEAAGAIRDARPFTFPEALRSMQLWVMWSMVFLIATTGLGLISQLSPMAQDVMLLNMGGTASGEELKALAIASGGIVAVAAVFNGIGRLLWAWISDALGRKRILALLFLTGAAGCLLLSRTSSITVFTVLVCYLLACYGGGLACMPAFTADEFGNAHIGKIYGVIFTACGFAGIAGPYIFASVKDMTGSFSSALAIEAALLASGFILAVTFRSPRHPQGRAVKAEGLTPH